ncbi:glyoxylate bypass operon transcriptional repressor IclR [Paralimibaculum aggregatum]|uniref:Glyoxylate bypass operon transcriptional repressor IclR n=1 Tax=Paralimibaculum aggregatum TaxID=3036245 RepID=A0ABQ6LPL3_9RHOB|nr:IclR family transcriptional regulator C-terminal domain-containing protein [Limibaculum sp. NKW23]GMG82619.1 glyoxylate bypass operon transcriptional repressor IclR [Limibaculum sp. NKW23]
MEEKAEIMEENARNGGQVRSLTRALNLLRTLAAHPGGLTLTEAAEATRLPPSTTHRLLTTLEAERFVRTDGQLGLWRIGVAAFYVGAAFARSRDTLAMTRPYLARLMEMSGETANLFVESDGEVVCIGQIESRHAMRAITGVGGRVLLHASGAGKALLAHMSAERRAELLDRGSLESVTELTITHRDRLARALDEVRELGYAIDDEEHALGLRCVAAPLFDEMGRAVAAISVSGPSARISRERLAPLGRMVAQAALEATRDFGGEAPVAAQ